MSPNHVCAHRRVQGTVLLNLSIAGWLGLAIVIAPGPAGAQRAPIRVNSPNAESATQHDHDMTVTVQSPEGRPLAGATVTGPFLRSSRPEAAQAGEPVTDERGQALVRFSFPFAQLPNVNLTVRHPDYATREIVWSGEPPAVVQGLPTNYTVKLAPLITVGGIVRNDQGQPLPDVQVAFFGRSTSIGYDGRISVRVQENSSLPLSGPDAVKTDRNGVWVRKDFPADLTELAIEVLRPGGAGTQFGTGRPGMMGGGELSLESLRQTNAVLIVPDGVSVRGIVVDERGQPVPGITMMERGGSMMRYYYFTNGTDGRFELTHRVSADLLLGIRSPQHAAQSVPVLLEGKAPPEIRIVLTKARPMRLRIVGDQDEPIPAARVQTLDYRNRGLLLDWSESTDADGRVVWTNAPNQTMVMMVTAPNYPPRQIRLKARDEEIVVRMRQAPAESIQVRVTVVEAGNGRAIAGATVRRGFRYGDDTEEWGKTDANGRFQAALTAKDMTQSYDRQSFAISALAEGYSLWSSEERFMFAEGDLELTMELKKSRPPAGIVLQPDGQPAVNAKVALNPTQNPLYSYQAGDFQSGGQGVQYTRTAQDGSFRFTAAAEDNPLVITHPTGFAALTIEELLASGKVPLQPWAQVEGVLRSSGKPVPRERVVIRSPLSWMSVESYRFMYSTTTDKSGRFAFTNVVPGEHLLYRMPRVVNGPNTESHRLAFTVKPGETKRIDYTFGGRVVTGFVNADGPVDWTLDAHVLVAKQGTAPREPAYYGLGGQAGYKKARRAYVNSPAVLDFERKQQQFQLLFDADGNFRVEDVPPGNYELRVQVSQPPPPNQARSRGYSGERRPIGNLYKEVIVPPGEAGSKVDLGTFELAVQLPPSERTPPISFQTTTLDGQRLDLTVLRGRPVVLAFWASWAPQSPARLADLRSAVTNLTSGTNITFVTVNLDEDPALARQGVAGLDRGWKHTRLEGTARAEITEKLSVNTLPLTLVLDPDGSVIARDISGRRLVSTLERITRKLAQK